MQRPVPAATSRVRGALAAAVLVVGLAAACSADPVGLAPAPQDGQDSSSTVEAPVTAAAATPEGDEQAGAVGAVAPPPVTPKPVAATGGLPSGFTWTEARVTAADLPSSWRKGCPVGPESLRAVTVGYHAMDGRVRTGVLVIHEDMLTPTRRAFARLFELQFPITSIRPVDEFDGDDDRSMAADNTSAFNCRAAVNNGPTSWSKHAYGRAIDINPLINPYVLDGEVLPPAGKKYTDRSARVPGMITVGSLALKAFTDNGFTWGGTWSNPDYQHMQR